MVSWYHDHYFVSNLNPMQSTQRSITSLASCRFTFKLNHSNQNTTPHCWNCQRLGHIKYYCLRTPRWIKCSENHPSNQCQLHRPAPSMCANWGGGGHTQLITIAARPFKNSTNHSTKQLTKSEIVRTINPLPHSPLLQHQYLKELNLRNHLHPLSSSYPPCLLSHPFSIGSGRPYRTAGVPQ